MKLEDLQTSVFDFLQGRQNDPEQLDFIENTKGISRSIRLGSYKKSQWNRMISVIQKDFKVTAKFLGANSFYNYLTEFLEQYPSKTHFINEISRDLPNYIANNRPVAAADFIVALAQLEWKMNESFYNFADYNKLKLPSPIAGKTTLYANPSLILTESPWPLHKIWNEEKSYSKEDSHLSIWTLDDRHVRVRGWTHLEHQVLTALQNSKSLEESIEKCAPLAPTTVLTSIFGEKLPLWVELGLFRVNTK